MEWYEDPTRAQDEVRRTHWRGAWRMLGAQLALIVPAAILFPVFAQSKGGPKRLSGTRAVAYAIDDFHRRTGRWTTSLPNIRPRPRSDEPSRLHQIVVIKLSDRGGEAEYAIGCDRRFDTFLLKAGGSPRPTTGDASGTLSP